MSRSAGSCRFPRQVEVRVAQAAGGLSVGGCAEASGCVAVVGSRLDATHLGTRLRAVC